MFQERLSKMLDLKLTWLISGSGVSKSPSRRIGLRPGCPESTRRRYYCMEVHFTRISSVVPRNATRIRKHVDETDARGNLTYQ